jgi:hypothetical protein
MLAVKQSIMHVEGVVALGNEQIARQRGLVVLLEMRGQESASARQSLLMLEARQRERLVELERLRVELASMTRHHDIQVTRFILARSTKGHPARLPRTRWPLRQPFPRTP